MKVVIHIGQPKTGTTAIQRLLSKNRDRLISQGILYPTPNIKGLNHGVLTIATNNEIQRSLVPRVGEDYDQAMRTSLDAWSQISRAAQDMRPEVLLISSEFFFETKNVKKVSQLVRHFFPTAWDLSFLCYLRTPSDWYASALQQYLKASHKLPKYRPDHSLEAIKSYASVGEVVVRKYSRDALVNQNILDDFCSATNIDITTLRTDSNETNSSLSAEGTILLQEYRRRHHFHRNDVFTDDTKEFVSKIVAAEIEYPNIFTKLRLKPQICQLLDQENYQTRYIFENFGIKLNRDHGVEPISWDSFYNISDTKDAVVFSNSALQKLQEVIC